MVVKGQLAQGIGGTQGEISHVELTNNVSFASYSLLVVTGVWQLPEQVKGRANGETTELLIYQLHT